MAPNCTYQKNLQIAVHYWQLPLGGAVNSVQQFVLEGQKKL